MGKGKQSMLDGQWLIVSGEWETSNCERTLYVGGQLSGSG